MKAVKTISKMNKMLASHNALGLTENEKLYTKIDVRDMVGKYANTIKVTRDANDKLSSLYSELSGIVKTLKLKVEEQGVELDEQTDRCETMVKKNRKLRDQRLVMSKKKEELDDKLEAMTKNQKELEDQIETMSEEKEDNKQEYSIEYFESVHQQIKDDVDGVINKKRKIDTVIEVLGRDKKKMKIYGNGKTAVESIVEFLENNPDNMYSTTEIANQLTYIDKSTVAARISELSSIDKINYKPNPDKAFGRVYGVLK